MPELPQPTAESTIHEVREYYFKTLQTPDHAAVFNLNAIADSNPTFAFLELQDAEIHRKNQPKG
jgi:hypothetical protein